MAEGDTHWQRADGDVLSGAGVGFVVRVRDLDWGAFVCSNLATARQSYTLKIDPINKLSELTVVAVSR